jgi:hypothetical protein
MNWERKVLAALAGALLLVGCDIGARQVDYSPQRAFTADIDASLHHGPTASKPGMLGTEEPMGALPWELGGSRQ